MPTSYPQHPDTHSSLEKSHLILAEETKKIIQSYVTFFFFLSRKIRALNSKLFPYEEGRCGEREKQGSSKPTQTWSLVMAEALLIPSRQDWLARGIQSKQVGEGKREAAKTC